MSRQRFVLEEMAPAELVPNPGNFRRHPSGQKAALQASVDEHGWVDAPLWNRTSGNLIDGHARVELALATGEALIPVKVVEMPLAQERRLLRSFDAIGAMALVDDEALASLVESIDDAALEQLLGEVSEPASGLLPEADPDALPERVETRCKADELWQLGEHRLLCGDATKREDVERLMGGKGASIAVTSPPYNQQIDQFHPSGMHKEHNWVSKVERLAYADSMEEGEYQAWQAVILQAIYSAMLEGGSLFYNHKNRYREKQVISPLRWLPGPFKLRQEIIWSRPGSVTQNARMFIPSDERLYWLYKGDDFFFNDSTEIKSHSTVWRITPGLNGEHPVAFPVEIPLRCIEAASRPAEICYDPFAGSGTTIIACEQTGRVARCLEIEPRYVDVCLARWEQVTGKEAVRL